MPFIASLWLWSSLFCYKSCSVCSVNSLWCSSLLLQKGSLTVVELRYECLTAGVFCSKCTAEGFILGDSRCQNRFSALRHSLPRDEMHHKNQQASAAHYIHLPERLSCLLQSLKSSEMEDECIFHNATVLVTSIHSSIFIAILCAHIFLCKLVLIKINCEVARKKSELWVKKVNDLQDKVRIESLYLRYNTSIWTFLRIVSLYNTVVSYLWNANS